MTEGKPKKVVVVGSGVIGLSIALQLKVQGQYQVTILARDLPTDLQSREFASPWAGANWASSSSNPNQQRWDEATFKQWQKWSKELSSDIIAEMPFSLAYDLQGYKKQVADWHASFLPEFRSESDGKHGMKSTFRGVTLNVPAYLQLLEEQLKSTHTNHFPSTSSHQQYPVNSIRAEIKRLSEVFNHVPDADLIINASGLGARTLEDVHDDTVYPIRGQTVLVQSSSRMLKSPRCAMSGPKTGNFNVRESSKEDQEFDYVIPRAKSGSVICGGCAIPDEWDTDIDHSLSERILQRCVRLVPELLEDDIDPTSQEAWKSIKIIKQGVGLRPARESGMRIELEMMTSSEGLKYHILHAYGAGGGGYQSAYGVAVDSASKVDTFFNSKPNGHV